MRQGQKKSETLPSGKISDSFDSGGASSLAVESHPSTKKATNNHLLVALAIFIFEKKDMLVVHEALDAALRGLGKRLEAEFEAGDLRICRNLFVERLDVAFHDVLERFC